MSCHISYHVLPHSCHVLSHFRAMSCRISCCVLLRFQSQPATFPATSCCISCHISCHVSRHVLPYFPSHPATFPAMSYHLSSLLLTGEALGLEASWLNRLSPRAMPNSKSCLEQNMPLDVECICCRQTARFPRSQVQFFFFFFWCVLFLISLTTNGWKTWLYIKKKFLDPGIHFYLCQSLPVHRLSRV